MIAVVVFLAVFASAAGQACNELLSKSTVGTDLGNSFPIYRGNTEVPVYYSCITRTSNQSVFVAITAYVEGFLLDYRCIEPDGWEATDNPVNVTGIYMTDRDIESGKCSDCLTKSRGLSSGHCQSELPQIGSMVFKCKGRNTQLIKRVQNHMYVDACKNCGKCHHRYSILRSMMPHSWSSQYIMYSLGWRGIQHSLRDQY